MKETRDSFVFYRSFQDGINEIPEKDQLTIYKAIANYALNCEEPNLDGLTKLVWMLIKPQLDANRKRYINGCKGAEHGKKGGNPNFIKGKKNPYYNGEDIPKDNPNITPKITPNDNVNENKNENIKEKTSKKKDSAPASLSDRTKVFKDSLVPYVGQYGQTMIRAFFDYWSEPNHPSTKMKFEMQKTWSLAGRLRAWERRQNEK